MASSHEIQHPAIGTVKGKTSDGVAEFLGIKYAALDHWLDNAKLVQYHQAGLAADQYGFVLALASVIEGSLDFP